MTQHDERVRWTLTPEELRAAGISLAHATRNLFALRRKRRELVADLDSAIHNAAARMKQIADKIECGYEMRAPAFEGVAARLDEGFPAEDDESQPWKRPRR